MVKKITHPHFHCPIVQLVECLIVNQEVTGSSPVGTVCCTQQILKTKFGAFDKRPKSSASQAEVVGSNPTSAI